MVDWVIIGTLMIVLGLAGALIAEFKQQVHLNWTSKLVASSGFLVVGWISAKSWDLSATVIFCALVLSFVGDICLAFKSSLSFLLGLGAFLLAHLLFAFGFFHVGWAPKMPLIAVAPLFVFAICVLYWLLPDVKSKMRLPVICYVVAIVMMVLSAFGASRWPGELLIAEGAVLFMVSDLFVARQRFKKAQFANRLIGLPLYYWAQWIFASLLGKF